MMATKEPGCMAKLVSLFRNRLLGARLLGNRAAACALLVTLTASLAPSSVAPAQPPASEKAPGTTPPTIAPIRPNPRVLPPGLRTGTVKQVSPTEPVTGDSAEVVPATPTVPSTPAAPPTVNAPPNLTQPSPTPPTPGNVQQFETGIDYVPTSPKAKVTFNLEDADLPELVRLISSITGRRFIISNKARQIKATVYAPTQVTAAEAYRAFLSILEMNGLTVVPSGRYLKIVESTGIQQQPISTYTEDGAQVPSDDRYITRLHQLKNVGAEDVSNLLSRFATREGAITAYAPTNTIIITDTGSSIDRMMKLLASIDVAHTGEQMWVEPIHYSNAAELAERLTEIFPVGTGGGGGGGAGAAGAARAAKGNSSAPAAASAPGGMTTATVGARSGETRITKILSDERTNSLIIIATERAYLRILELIRQLDVPLEGSGRVHVHYLQHGDAEEIATTLSSFTGNAGGGGGRGGAGGQAGNAAGGPPQADLFEGQIKVTAHKASNALVITASLHDYASLKKVIKELDAPRRQVFIEAVVMELSVNRGRKLGISFHTGIPNFPEEGALGLVGSNAQGSLSGLNPESLTGLALGVRGPNVPEAQQLIGISLPSFGVAINALATSGEANILSTPHIIAMDNEQAEISVGANVPLQTSGFNIGALAGLGGLGGQQGAAGGAGGLGALAGLAGGGGGFNVPRQDVGTTIRITPHINDSEEIRLEVEEEISEAAPSTEGTLGVRSLTKRTAKTQMVAQDQQTVVIGGLMRDGVRTENTKIPILGDIPLIGALFRQTNRTTEKTNLLLFLTPYVVRDAGDLRSIYERKMRERQEFLDRYFVFGDSDYQAPRDYSRTRGLVAEIIRELNEVAEETRLLDESKKQPPLNHNPRPAVGVAPEIPSADGSSDVVISPNGDMGVISAEPPSLAPNEIPESEPRPEFQ
jgi:general secretion pathway protein D